ncbi:MAG: RDD family protein [Methanobrevibacter sp.]|nr:RDD family protein [Methanobrevibacter sp.]
MLSMFKKRALAYLIDWFVISAIFMILAVILYFPIVVPFSLFIIYNYFIYLLPIFIIFYFVYLETNKGRTIGKDIFDLKVVSEDGGNITYWEAIIRNLSKLYWIPIIFDLIIGRLIGESNERILGRWSKTMVVEKETI